MTTTPTDNAPGERDSENGRGESFLGRQSWGLAHYLWIALAVTLALGFIPRGVRKALESNTNKAEDWLPASYAESTDLFWFRDHFAGEAFVLVSWEGCDLGNEQQLFALEEALASVKDDEGWAWYPRIRSGPSTIKDLTEGQANLSRAEAIQRLEGALVGPEKLDEAGEPLGEGSRTTCLLAYLDDRLVDKNLQMRRAVERVRDITIETVGVPVEAIHLGGPPVDNITIDIEGEKTLIRLAGLSGLVGITLAYLCFRSRKLTSMVFWTAGVSAGASLALVYWFGIGERLFTGLDEARLGKADAILMSMPAVVYVLALSGAIHLVNYYRDERLEHGRWGAAERAVRVAWGPCLLAAFTTAVGLGALGSSDILPIQKFGIFCAIGVLVAVGLLFAIMPVFLFRFPPEKKVIEERAAKQLKRTGRAWYEPLANFVTTRHGWATTLCLAAMATVAVGLTKTTSSVQLLGLLDEGCQLITDYKWLEGNLGNLVPMEVIVALDSEQLRSPDEPAIDPTAGSETARYRMTMYERSQLTKALQARVESLPEISRALAASTFAGKPQDTGGSASFRQGIEYATSEKLEEARESLSEYLQLEEIEGEKTGRELWRVSARVTALDAVDYGQFVTDLKQQVEPVLDAYKLRDYLVAQLAAAGPVGGKARVCLLTETNDKDNPRLPVSGTAEAQLAELLRTSAGMQLSVYPLDGHFAADEATQAKRLGQLAGYDAVVALRPAVADKLAGGNDLKVGVLALEETPAERPPATEAMSTYTGVVPLVYKTQRELITSLQESIMWATVLIAIVMVIVLRSPLAGIASMIPNVFPIVMVFGSLGWLNIPIDIGIMMTASVALGVAVDDTLHFVTWFSRGIRDGLDRRSATQLAYERCATAMTQTTLIGGLGLAVFAVSTFTPTQEFGSLMIMMLGMALVGDLILLPALLCGPLGSFFAPGAPPTPTDHSDGERPAGENLALAQPTAVLPDSDLPTSELPAESEPTAAEASVPEPVAEEPAILAFPQPAEPAPVVDRQPVPRPEAMSPGNAALQAKLQDLRRRASNDRS